MSLVPGSGEEGLEAEAAEGLAPNSVPVESGASLDMDKTQNLVSDASEDNASPAWGPLSQKIERRMRQRYGHRRRFPFGFEFEDFQMTVMARIIEDLRKYRSQSGESFWSWFFVVADNVLVDLMRRESAQKRGGGRSAEGHDALHAVTDERVPSPTVMIRVRELEDAEMRCANRLSPHARDVYLKRRQGLSFSEIAEVFEGKSEATLRSTYKRAREEVFRGVQGLADEVT